MIGITNGPSTAAGGIRVVGYGTLISAASLARDIGVGAAAGKVFQAVVVREFVRLFNLRPDHYDSSAILSPRGNENGAMNVQPRDGASFNGVMFEVTEAELVELDRRERYYDRVAVPVADFASRQEMGEAFVYTAPSTSPWVVDDPRRLLPRWRDIELGRSGSYRLSPEFGAMFDRTTYLADGATLVGDRYAEVEDFVDIPRRLEKIERDESTP